MELTSLSGLRRTNICHQQQHCQQPLLSVEILPDESFPLLRQPDTCCMANIASEMAPVHMTRHPVTTSLLRTRTGRDITGLEKGNNVHLDRYWFCSAPSSRLNVIEALQEFWQKKLAVNSSSRNLQDDNMISYASEPVNYPPHVCFVTLPGGCSFGTLHQCTDRAEARRQAAHIALVNCIYNELPSRKITDKFIDDAVRETFQLDPVADESAVDAFRFVLEATRGQTMLDYIALANRLLVMHWSGALKSMSQRTVTRQEVLKCALMTPWFSEDYRSELALEWMAVERTEPGRIDRELSTAVSQLDNARQTGRELAFPRLKRDVLQLAISQLDVT